MRKALAFPVVAVFVLALFTILQETGAEEPDYEAPELQLKFNLKEDGETLSQQNKMPEDPEAHSTGRAPPNGRPSSPNTSYNPSAAARPQG